MFPIHIPSKPDTKAHSHCSLWEPPEDLLQTMRGGQAWQRYSKDMEDKQKEAEELKVLCELAAEEVKQTRRKI